MEAPTFEWISILSNSEGELVCCDYHPKFGLAYIAKQKTCRALVVNGTIWRQWDDDTWPNIWNIRFSASGCIFAWNIPGGIVALAPREWHFILIGEVSNVIASPNYLFATYSEDSSSLADPDQLESNIAAVFSTSGDFVLSLNKMLDKVTYDGIFMEVSHACAGKNDEFYFLAHGTPYIWILDVKAATLQPLPADDVENAIAISADQNSVYLLERGVSSCMVRSTALVDRSWSLLEVDRGPSAILLDRCAAFKPVIGVLGGGFLTSGRDKAELLKHNFSRPISAVAISAVGSSGSE